MNSYRARLEANQVQPCIVPGCKAKRIHFSKYCAVHSQRGYQYGHPEGRRIRPKEYEEELAEVRKVIEQNRDHEGIQIAVRFFDDWLQCAAEGKPGVLASDHFFRLYQEGVTGEDLLIESAAIYLFQKRNPQILLLGRSLDIATALAVLCKRKNRMGYGAKKYVKVEARRNVGSKIAREVGLMLMNIADSIEAKAKRKAQSMNAFSKDIVVTFF